MRGGIESEGRGNPSCLEERGRVCLFAYSFKVDRHRLRPRDYKMVDKRNYQRVNLMPHFTLQTSIFTLPSLAFLETDTEAYVGVAETGGEVVALR